MTLKLIFLCLFAYQVTGMWLYPATTYLRLKWSERKHKEGPAHFEELKSHGFFVQTFDEHVNAYSNLIFYWPYLIPFYIFNARGKK
jgi:hypothetical protein